MPHALRPEEASWQNSSGYPMAELPRDIPWSLHPALCLLGPPAWIQLLLCLHGDSSSLHLYVKSPLTDCRERVCLLPYICGYLFVVLLPGKGASRRFDLLQRSRPSTLFYDSVSVMSLFSVTRILPQSGMKEDEAFSTVGLRSYSFQILKHYLLREREESPLFLGSLGTK